MATFSDAQFASIVKGTSGFLPYSFPGMEGAMVAMRCLSEAELDGCRIEAQARIRKFAKTRGWDAESAVNIDPEIQTRFIQRSILARACFDIDTVNKEDVKPVHFFTGEDQVDQLTSVTCARLFDIYLEHQEWSNPRREMTKDEIDELLGGLGKAPASMGALSLFEHGTLVRLCITLASALRSASPHGKSSTSQS